MNFLVFDVSNYGRNLAFRIRKRTVAFLPREALPHPMGRTALELLHGRGERLRSRQDKQEVNVVGRPAGGHESEAFASRNAANVCVEVRFAVRRNQRLALFGAEDAVNEIARIRMSHGCAVPTGLQFYIVPAIPTPRRGNRSYTAAPERRRRNGS